MEFSYIVEKPARSRLVETYNSLEVRPNATRTEEFCEILGLYISERDIIAFALDRFEREKSSKKENEMLISKKTANKNCHFIRFPQADQ